ncbi:hypothetical protein BVG79_01070 [Ketogulonicigenium robustum]|uniref:Uncharacterized protein n=1 Tax=Ketogulonicigenium robustum TaxID=92947 RepID=A0A1W6NYS9_9RHOB|nr:hypothetical protein [Ketogulonicigenium robustum]ARO14416.1 hypothetical protein BVG79_01070 [Ketogulonicigenium robustum]
MEQKLLSDIEAFRDATGLSEHRVGIILAKNGRLLERLRADRPFQVPTVRKIKDALKRETAIRLATQQSDAAK